MLARYEPVKIDSGRIVASAEIDEPFVVFSKRYENLCVSIVDIVNSTRITAGLSLEKTTKYYSLFLNSMAKISEIFGAKVVKNIGDSLLLYYPQYMMINHVLECNFAMLQLRDSLNEKFKSMGLPEIDYRISSDYGPTLIAKCQRTTQEDIFGNSVNMCSKINRLGEKNSLVIGSDLYSLAKSIPDFSFAQTTSYRSGFKNEYPVYKVSKRK